MYKNPNINSGEPRIHVLCKWTWLKCLYFAYKEKRLLEIKINPKNIPNFEEKVRSEVPEVIS